MAFRERDGEFLAVESGKGFLCRSSLRGWAGRQPLSQHESTVMLASARPLNLRLAGDKSLSLCRQSQTNMETTSASFKQRKQPDPCCAASTSLK